MEENKIGTKFFSKKVSPRWLPLFALMFYVPGLIYILWGVWNDEWWLARVVQMIGFVFPFIVILMMFYLVHTSWAEIRKIDVIIWVVSALLIIIPISILFYMIIRHG